MSVCPDLSESSKNVSNFHEDPLDTEKNPTIIHHSFFERRGPLRDCTAHILIIIFLHVKM